MKLNELIFFNHVKVLTSEAVRHVCFEDNVAEDGGQRQRFVVLISQGDVPIARLQSIQRENPLSDQFTVVIVHGHPEHRQIRQDYLWDRGVCVLFTLLVLLT